jgi:hypothetical protein
MQDSRINQKILTAPGYQEEAGHKAKEQEPV